MDLDTIRLMCGYDRWVNQRLIETAEEIPAERLEEKFGASFDSILGTLAHMLGAQVAWLSRWKGVSPAKLLGAADFDSLDDLKKRWAEHDVELDRFLEELTPERLNAPLSYKDSRGNPYTLPLGQQMLHMVNHGTHHRSELADMLTRAGHTPLPTDLIRYCIEISGQG